MRYHRWAITTVISALLERRVWLDRGRLGITFPNLYTFLVGGPATGKSTAMDFASAFIERLPEPAKGMKKPTIGPTKITQAALYKNLRAAERKHGKHIQSPVFLCPRELATNMTDFGGGTLTNELIDFYDSKSLDAVFVKDTMKDGVITLRNPSITLLGGTTPEYLAYAEKNHVITSGLASRIICAVETNFVAKEHTEVPTDQLLFDSIMADALTIYRMAGVMRFTASAQAAYIDIAKQNDIKCYESPDTFYANYYGRKTTHIQKVAMTLAAQRFSYEITEMDIVTATKWLDEIEPEMGQAFGLRSIEKDDTAVAIVLKHIPKEPRWIDDGDLLGDLRKHGKHLSTGQTFTGIIDSLVKGGEVRTQTSGITRLLQRAK